MIKHLVALTGLCLALLAGSVSAEDRNSFDGFKPVAPVLTLAPTVSELVDQYMSGFPETTEGRIKLRYTLHEHDGGLIFNLLMSGYADDSVKGEHYRGFIKPGAEGWELVRVGRKLLCYRGMSSEGLCT